MIQGLASIRLEVGELDRSLQFYLDGLRFELVVPPNGVPRRAELRAGTLSVLLAEAPPTRSRRAVGVGFRVDVLALDAYHDAIVARGIDTGPESDEGGARQFPVRDPDGYVWFFREVLG